MATTTDGLTYVTMPIVKHEEMPDGNLMVYGKATDGSVDSDQQVCSPEWSADALSKWMASGPNVRVMHNPKLYPAGTGLSLEVDRDGDGGHWVKSLVVEPTAKELVRHKALRAYSIGITQPVVRRDPTGKARGGIIDGGEIYEVSLVDRPANSNCGITLVKSANHTGTDWSRGDLDALLRAAQETASGAAKASGPATGNGPDAVWTAERQAWLDREPTVAAGDGTAYLAKRAEWQRWQADGEAAGLAEDGYPLWLEKRSAKPTPDEGDGDGEHGEPDKDEASSADGGEPDEKAADDGCCPKCGGKCDGGKCGKCGGKADGDGTAEKGAKDCANPDCDARYHADSKLRTCSRCGHDLPTADEGAEKAASGGLEGPVDGHLAGTVPAGPHREPDGDAVEQLEADAGWPDPDNGGEGQPHDHVPASLGPDGKAGKAAGPSYTVARAHDALCPHLPWGEVADAYPTLKSVGEALTTTDVLVGRTPYSVLAALADVQAMDPVAVADARLSKGYGESTPTAGTAPAAGGGRRHYYTTAARESARAAMQAMHDHIVGVFPDLCPAVETKSAGPAAVEVPLAEPVVAAVTPPAVAAKSVDAPDVSAAGGGYLTVADLDAAVTKALADVRPATPDVTDLVAKAVADATETIRKEYETTITALKAEIDELGAQPDPSQAPVRGAVTKAATTTVAEKAQPSAAEREHAEYVAYLQRHADPSNPNAVQRDQAATLLARLVG